MLLSRPWQTKKIYDQMTQTKLPLDFNHFGKPNQLISFSGVNEDNTFIMNQLANMSSEEFVAAAEACQLDQNSRSQYRKVFEQLVAKNREENGHITLGPAKTKKKEKGNRTMRILETFDASTHLSKDSYVNRKLRENKNRAATINHGLTVRGVSDTLGMQAIGKSQLVKELNECGNFSKEQRRIFFMK